MKQSVNLIEQESAAFLTPLSMAKSVGAMLALGLLVTVGLTIYHAMLGSKQSKLDQQMASLHQGPAQESKQLVALKEQRDQLKEKYLAAKASEKILTQTGKKAWSRKLEALAVAHTKGCWITEVSIDNPNQIQLQGRAQSPETLMRMLGKLRVLPSMRSIQIQDLALSYDQKSYQFKVSSP